MVLCSSTECLYASRCIVDIDVHTRREEHYSRSRIDDRKRAAFPRSSVITVAYLSPCFVHCDSSSRHTLRSADRCADTMNPDVTPNENDENNSSRELRKRFVSCRISQSSKRALLRVSSCLLLIVSIL
ncbi:hypothetical protein AVEN_201984-1 [Araneus ventricosus]|uniref:Uncharacterized protein n=1 Tax=Araneus ventricosus TaxID=182803 RepID=A0A4Y2KVP8_ARAVE|nr:hypothetical protein AVEN_201984-1 [Araneus ventricosus]